MGRKRVKLEILHYINLFKNDVDWHEIGAYEDLLLEAAFSKTMQNNLENLAAMKYVEFIYAMKLSPFADGRCYSVYKEITDKPSFREEMGWK